MKIIHFIDRLKIGGAQTHLYTMVMASRKINPEIEIIICSLFDDGEIGDWFRKENIEVVIFNINNRLENKRYLKIIKDIKEFIIIQNPLAVISHLTWSRLFANTAAWRVGVPKRIVFEQGDIYMNSPKFRMANFFSQFLYEKSVVCSESLKKWTHKTHRISNSKIEVYHNCVDIEKFNNIKINNSPNYERPEADYIFISVGTLGRGVNKRIDIIIKAIYAANNKCKKRIGLIVCGDGDQKNELQSLIVSLHMLSSIKLLGNRNDVNIIMKECDAFIHAAPYEPFGIVAIEAMASGLPVILPNSGGMPEIINDSEQGFLYEPLNVDALSTVILKLVMLPHHSYSIMKNKARDRVKAKFSAESYIKKFNEQFLLYR